MKNKNDFVFEKDLLFIEEVEIKPKGWKPIIIQFGIKQFGQSHDWEMCWRVKGTNHIFRIGLNDFYKFSKNGYEEHFKEVLEIFRKDYLKWYKQGFPEDWMQKYKNEFGDLIFTF